MPAKTKKAEESKMLGKKAPAIKLLDDKGDSRSLSEFKDSYVLIYFYPKDMTPGCTQEAELFRDNLKKLKKLGLEVIGISCDDVEKHKKFKDKYKLNFPLLADTDKKVVEKYGGKWRRTFVSPNTSRKTLNMILDSVRFGRKFVL